MGKRKAMRVATLKIADATNKSAQAQLDALNRTIDNLTVLLQQETDKNADLEAKLAEFKTKTTIEKTSKKNKKQATVTQQTDAVVEAVQG